MGEFGDCSFYPSCATPQPPSPTRHYYVDVPNPEESTYETCEQHVRIDPAFREEVEKQNENDISQFLALPELIPAQKRKRQQPLLDYTNSRILTSEDYMQGLQELLAKKEESAAAAKKKKEDREANKEQRKMAKEQQQKEKQERAAQREQKRKEKEMQQRGRSLPGGRGGRRGGSVQTAAEGRDGVEVRGQQAGGDGWASETLPLPGSDCPRTGPTPPAALAMRAGGSPWSFGAAPEALYSVGSAGFMPPRPSPMALPHTPPLPQTASFQEPHNLARAPPLHTVPRRWNQPVAGPPAPRPPPNTQEDGTSQPLSYLQVIAGLQQDFYNPHATREFYNPTTTRETHPW